jgi:ABC-type branched-subunit amino acid transport system substrate-binding protein
LIGVLLPLSGRYAAFGKELQQGLELARAGNPTSRPVRFVYRDTGADSAVVTGLVGELAALPGLLAVVGPLLNGEAVAAATRAEQEKLPLLLLAPREGVPGGHVFRAALTAAAQAAELAAFAKNERLQRFALLSPANRQGEFHAGLFAAAVTSRGGQVVARQSYPPDTVDLRQPLQAVAEESRLQGGRVPDALFLPDDARQVAQIIPQLGFVRFDLLQLLGTNSWNDPDLVRLAGPQIEGAVFVDAFFAGSPRPEVSDFVLRFQAAYGAPPGLVAAYGYDAARILLNLLSPPEVNDRETVRRALLALRDFPGVTGLTGFAPEGEAQRRLFLLQVQDGAVVQIN